MNIELIPEEDVIRGRTFVIDHNYRNKILPHVDKFKLLIENGGGKAEIRMRNIRDILGYEEYKNRSDNSLYMKIRDTFLEFGIKVQMRHHYGCNLILTFISDKSEIMKGSEAVRIRNENVAKKYGFSSWGEYILNRPSYRITRTTDMRFDENNKFHLMNIGKKYIAPELFPGCVINKRSTGCRFNLQGGFDWEVNGIKIKHAASHIRCSTNEEGFQREFFQWNIGKNEEADVFFLTGWGSVGSLDLMKGWVIDKKEAVNGREFWDRTSFLISTHDRSINKYCKFEVDDRRLDKIRENIEIGEKQIEVYPGQIEEEIDNFRLEIKEWYDTYFRF